MARWASAPENKSPTMARATTVPPPAEKPCSSRKTMSISNDVAMAAPMLLSR